MKTLRIYERPGGSTVNLRVRKTKDVVTYAVFVIKYTDDGRTQETWRPAALESRNGAELQLDGNAQGYRLILHANIRSSDEASASVSLSFTGQPQQKEYKKKVPLPKADGPVVQRGWSILIGDRA